MLKLHFGRIIVVSCAILALNASMAQAAFVGSTGTVTVGGVQVSASATVTLGNGTVMVDLQNDRAGITTSGQALSGISLTFANSVSSVAMQSIAGQLVLISSNGTPTKVIRDGSGNLNPGTGNTIYSGPGSGGTSLAAGRWKVTSSTPPTVLALGGSQPDHLLLGDPGSNGRYGSNLQTQFNPYFQKNLKLNLTAAGVTASSVINTITFFFGTGPDGSFTVKIGRAHV